MILDVERDELWQQLSLRPNSVRFAEWERLLRLSGWELEHVRGSHYIYRRGPDRFSLPFRRGHVLPVYVRQVLQRTRDT